MAMVKEISAIHTQSSGLKIVRSIHRAQKEQSLRVSLHAASIRHPGVHFQ
jgi:hypothetical protein